MAETAPLPLVEPRRVTFTVYGIPKPKGSARGFVVMKAGKARAIVTSDNKSLKSWEHSVRDAAQHAVGEHFFTAAVRLEIHFWFPRPKSVSVKKRPHFTTKPDLSKLVRGAEDALNGVLFKDDSQVVVIAASKRYVDDGPAGAAITVEEITGPVWALLARPQPSKPSPTGRPKEDPWSSSR